jgi:hypothetical protein
MVIITTVSYPSESAKDMAAKFLEAPQYPDFMTRQGPYVNSSLYGGILVTSVYELDNSKLADGMNFLGNYMATYFGISGFKYEVKPYFSVDEGLKMLGM